MALGSTYGTTFGFILPVNDVLTSRTFLHQGPYARGYLMRSRLVRLALTAARRLPADSSRSPDQVVVSLPADPMIADEEDPSTAICPPAATEMLQITCHIVFSSTYRRPQMLCSAHSQGNGTPASLETLVASGLLRPPGLAAPNEEGIAIELAPETANGAAFPLLGLAEHPTTGAAMWALHPCHLAEVVEEIFAAESPHGPARTGRRFLETWLMVVGSVLDLSTGS